MNPIRSNFRPVHGGSLVPDYSNANRLAIGIAQQIKTEKVQQAEAEEAQTIAANLSDLTQKELLSNPESRDQLLQLYNLDKEMGVGVLEILKAGDAYAKNELAEVNAEAERINTNMINLAGTNGDVLAAKNFLRQTIIEKNTNGIETPKLTMLLGMPDDQFLAQLRTNQAIIGTVSALAPVQSKVVGGVLVADDGSGDVIFDSRDPVGAATGGFVGDIQAPSPKDFTPESISAYQRSGDAADLVRRTLTGTEQRQQERVDVSLRSAQQIPIIERAVEILTEVETGGVDGARLKAKQFFGVESADEGELSNMLGKAVLSQLRATFGSQFTESEGERLTAIEPGLGKSTAANLRLFNNLLRRLNTDVTVGRRNANTLGDEGALLDIDDFLAVQYGGSGDAGQGGAASATNSGDDLIGKWTNR